MKIKLFIKYCIVFALLLLCQIIFACSPNNIEQNPLTINDEDLYKIQVNYRWGFINQKGEIIIEPQYHEVRDFYEGFAVVGINLKYGYINKKGEWLVKPQYDYADSFHEGMAPVGLNEKYGYINIYGNLVIDCKYKRTYWFRDGLALVVKFSTDIGLSKRGLAGFIDKTGETVIPFIYSDDGVNINTRLNNDPPGTGFQEGLAPVYVYDAHEIGFINKKGKMVIPPRYDLIKKLFTNGYAIISQYNENNNGIGVIDKTGKIIIDTKYDFCDFFKNDGDNLLIRCELNGKYELRNINNEVVKKFNYTYVSELDEGLAMFADENDLCGFIDETGKVIIKAQYYYADKFSQGLANFTIKTEDGKEKYGYIDKTGKVVIPPQFDIAYPFDKNGIACVRILEEDAEGREIADDEGLIGYINTKGEYIWEPTK